MQALEHKIPPPLVFFLIAAGMWGGARLVPPTSVAVGLSSLMAEVISWVSALIAILAFAAFGRAGTTIDPVHIESASMLVTTGIYRFTRNPMYLALALLLLSWAVHLTAPLTAFGPPAFMLFTTRFQIVPEERALAVKFGAAYDAYRARVRRWL